MLAKMYGVAILFSTLIMAAALPAPVQAASILQVNLQVIKAEAGGGRVDPKLRDFVEELKPVLNFTGFTLLESLQFDMMQNTSYEAPIAGERVLKFHFTGFNGPHARLEMDIWEKGRRTFNTTVLLVDNGSVIIGGPPLDTGMLLLRVRGRFK
ncbi:hypothetical protein DBT_2398 [Dissulfuribacter thermophilus]|uniref:Uncharacterized protein n=1 Tax=Dissulfuribacter thermophilus TaxID=1156395 RepID=A0A1B9F2U3_9BACT|nr:hypothetical protein [Dissulfuribacter thermophilus]OCC14193.1 hypothetical protein DBT_2398 [Dissulfuribacter thermophilus]